MKRLASIAALLLFASVSAVYAQETTVSFNDLDRFDKISATSIFDVEVRKGDSFEVTVTVDEKYYDQILVTSRKGWLNLELRNEKFIKRLKRDISDITLKAYVTLPELKEVSLSGISEMKICDSFEGDSFKVSTEGTSCIEGLDIKTDELTVTAGGVSRIQEAKIEALNANITFSGAASTDIDIRSENFILVASGAASMDIKGGSRNLNIEGSGAAAIRFDESMFTAVTSECSLSGASKLRNLSTDYLKITLSGCAQADINVNKEMSSVEISGAAGFSWHAPEGTDPVIRNINISGANTFKRKN